MVSIITYGCKVNFYESEQVASLLSSVGIENKMITDGAISRENQSDIFVINSCAVTNMAEKKSRYGVSKIKKYHPNAKIITMGCALGRKSPEAVVSEITNLQLATQIKVIHGREKAFIKVQDGCKNFCSYCIIPHKRNVLSYREISEVVLEINNQPKKVEEVILCGINLCYYPNFINLCKAVDKCGRKWSISSLEPIMITNEFLVGLAECKNFIPNFYLCLQSGSDKVLKDMNRNYTSLEYIQKIQKIREVFLNAKISTDIIIGYPTESEEDFNSTIQAVQKIKFDSIHIFPFSPREGTPAYNLKPITNSIVTKRFEILKNLLNNKNKFN